jgi:hypothetical protein
MTTSKACFGAAPKAAGSVSGPIDLGELDKDPGQPWVMSSGNACGCFERR